MTQSRTTSSCRFCKPKFCKKKSFKALNKDLVQAVLVPHSECIFLQNLCGKSSKHLKGQQIMRSTNTVLPYLMKQREVCLFDCAEILWPSQPIGVM